jgi:hypothetical protein
MLTYKQLTTANLTNERVSIRILCHEKLKINAKIATEEPIDIY